MHLRLFTPALAAACLLGSCLTGRAALTPEQLAQLPPPADHPVDFAKEIKPIFEASCIKCHGRGRDKGGFRLDNRETLLKGGDSGAAIVPGKGAESYLVELVQGFDPDNVMPKKGTRLTPQQVGLLRAWIDQGAKWDPAIVFSRPEPLNLKPHRPELPANTKSANPVDRFLEPYFAAHNIQPAKPVDDRVFARRVYLDVIGLLPPPEELETFVADHHADKREQLVQRLLARNHDYAENWITFWNDLLRNDYKGTGYIDGGRKQITKWLYSVLLTNLPYDQFVAQLVDPGPESEGFTKGIVWRGVVNASQTPQMQAAQNISQIFMGVNLKCASCHDSFINDLTLADAYGLAGVYADGPLEMVLCDKPTGKTASLKFLYPELGTIDPQADKTNRLQQLAHCLTCPQDGRLSRTLVNRLWGRLLGRALIEPVDDMEQHAWNQDLLDWLAEDFAAHNYDVKHLLAQILTSRAYQLPAVNLGEQTQSDYVFRGPAVRRLTAEQFRDALTAITGIGYSTPAAEVAASGNNQKKFKPPIPIKWIWRTPHAEDQAPAEHVYFRKTLELAAVPADATALVECDNSFTLYLNGKALGSGDDFKTTYLYDLRPHLKPGLNVLAIDAVNRLRDNSLPPDGVAPPPDSANPAGLLFYARIRSNVNGASKTNDIASDKSWLCSSAKQEGWQNPEFTSAGWKAAVQLGDPGLLPWRTSVGYLVNRLVEHYPGQIRAALVAADPLMVALGRPNREQVVTTRPSTATTLEALELTNGGTLAEILQRGAENLLNDPASSKNQLIPALYEKALGRKPTRGELQLARQLVGQPAQPAGVEDLLWAVTMLPEFQLIY